jgi:hypothetical protein
MKLAASIAAFAVLTTGFAVPPQPPAAQDKPAHDSDSVLESHMHGIEDALHALRRSLKDPAKSADSLASIAKLQADAIVAKSELPRMLPHVPEAERPEFIKNYRREMVRMLEASLKLESAVLDGKQEPINAAYEALRSMEDPAHDRFTEEEK